MGGYRGGGGGGGGVAGEAPRLFVFGGESLCKFKLNDVWTLDLATLRCEALAPNVFSNRRCDRELGGRRSARVLLGV